MKFVGKTVRACLGIMSWMVLTFPLVLWAMLRGGSRFFAVLPSMPLSISLTIFQYPVIGALSGIAWWSLRKGKPSAQIWTLLACVATLPSMSYFSYVGIAGLMVFWKKDVVAAMASGKNAVDPAKHLPGDGTHRYIEQVVPYLTFGALYASSLLWERWGKSAGLPQQFSVGWVSSALLFLSDMILRGFQIGPFHARIESARWRYRFHLAGVLGGGAVAMVPRHLKNIRSRIFVMTIGGPVASLVTGATATILALTAPYAPWKGAWEFFALVGSLGLIDFVVNLIPQRPESNYSDGSQIFQIVNGGLWADRHMAMAMVGSSSVTKLAPRDWDGKLLQRAADHQRSGMEGIHLRLFMTMHLLDSGNPGLAVAAYREALLQDPKATDALDADLFAELVFIEATFGGNVERARELWQKMETKGGYKKEIDYGKGRAALLCLEGKLEEAEETLRVAQGFANALPDAGIYNFDRWCLAQVRSKIEEAKEQRRVQSEIAVQLQHLSELVAR
jgi:hypothetical protein